MENEYSDCYCELLDKVANKEPYIIYENESTDALEKYGTFDAIQKVIDYEKEQFGKTHIEIKPCEVANMLYYVMADEFLHDTFSINDVLDEIDPDNDLWNAEATADVNSELIKRLKKFL